MLFMGQCLDNLSSGKRLMSHNYNSHSAILTKHIKKKAKQDTSDPQSLNNSRYLYRQMNPPALEPRRDLPLHKIPELLAKITGTLSSTISSSSSAESKHSSSSNDRRERFFDNYSDKPSSSLDEQRMSLDGILRLCNDLSIEPDSYEVLLFCFLCRAKQMYTLTKQEFLLGLANLGSHIDNLSDLRASLFQWNISSYENEFYMWTYHYGLIDGQRCLTSCNAISLWRLFYSKGVERPELLDHWLDYLEKDPLSEVPKTITCDTWKIFPQFAKFIQVHGYSAYDDNEAWPFLFDGFVEHQQKTKEMLRKELT